MRTIFKIGAKIIGIITGQARPSPEPMKTAIVSLNDYLHLVARKLTNRLWYVLMILYIPSLLRIIIGQIMYTCLLPYFNL